jgi:hypothetical protein
MGGLAECPLPWRPQPQKSSRMYCRCPEVVPDAATPSLSYEGSRMAKAQH